MSAISIETKKMTDLDQVTLLSMNDLVLVHTANGMRVCTLKNMLDSGGANVPIATTAIAGIVKPDGTTIKVKADGTLSAVIPDPDTAAVGTLGVVKPDGTTITILPDGTISAKQTELPVATTAKAGIVKPDGTTVTVQADGTIAAKQSEIATTAKAGLVKPDGVTLSIGTDGLLKVLGAGLNGTVEKNAGAHNSIFRGKNLGTSVTAAQYAAISAGTFDDLFIGDYWVIGGVNYRIAAFDYYLRCGDTDMNTHHVVIVPDSNLYNHVMNDTNTTEGGYMGSKMYTEGLNQAKTTIKAAFPNHVLKHRVYLTNAVSNGKPSAGAWCDSEVELMNEQMVYGGAVFMPGCDGTTVPHNYRVEKSQLPLFAHRPDLISNRLTFWLRDVVTAAFFAVVTNHGDADYYGASGSFGVRPAFSIF